MVTKWKKFTRNAFVKFLALLLCIATFTTGVLIISYAVKEEIRFDVLNHSDYLNSYECSEEIWAMVAAFHEGETVSENSRELKLSRYPNGVPFKYYFHGGGKTFYNVSTPFSESTFTGYEHYWVFTSTKEGYAIGSSYGNSDRYYTHPYYILSSFSWELSEQGNYTVALSIPASYVEAQNQILERERETALYYILAMAGSFVLSALFLLYLLCVSGRKTIDNEVHMTKLDKIYADILLILGVAAVMGLAALWVGVINTYYFSNWLYSYNIYAYYTVIGLIAAVAMGISIAVLCSLMRQLKNKTLIKHTLLYRIFSWGKKWVKKGWDLLVRLFSGKDFPKSRFMDKMYLRLLIYLVAVFVFIFFGALLTSSSGADIFLVTGVILSVILTAAYFVARHFVYSDMQKIINQVDEIASGHLETKYTLSSFSSLSETEEKLSNIGMGLNESVQRQVKSERMKVDLITNVSHDLKTPLTSIIGYVDLLGKEDLPPEASEYVSILAQKSDRLKNIVADLFELAKSTSGNVELELEPLDLKTLLLQTLGDMEDKIEHSGLEIRQRLPEEDVMILGDGKNLYRVLQNLIDNALQYSMPGTRIYIELTKATDYGILSVKNTAGYEMGFTSDEILERFTRGESSRTTEGNGLGLSIANSFAKNNGGELEVIIDGDQFKTILTFPLFRGTLNQTPEAATEEIL